MKAADRDRIYPRMLMCEVLADSTGRIHASRISIDGEIAAQIDIPNGVDQIQVLAEMERLLGLPCEAFSRGPCPTNLTLESLRRKIEIT